MCTCCYRGGYRRVSSIACTRPATSRNRRIHRRLLLQLHLCINRVLDRTYIAVKRQLAAMGCPRYEVYARQWTGTDKNAYFIRDSWLKTPEEVLQMLGTLRHLNSKGNDIWILPRTADCDPKLVLVDDITQAGLDLLAADGVEPVVITETSPANNQAWVRVPMKLRPLVVARALCRRLGADPGGIGDANQRGRLAGFTNRAPWHRRSNGTYPFVLLRAIRPQARAINPIGSLAPYIIDAQKGLPAKKDAMNHTPPQGGGGYRLERPGCAGR